MRKQGIPYILLILALWSCREDFERNVSTPVAFTPELIDDFMLDEDMVNASLIGFVQDEMQNPIADALVILNGTPTTTDIYGHFFYTDHPMNKEGTTVEIQADNYHQHSKLFYPSEGATEKLDIVLTEIEDDSEFNGLIGGSLLIDEDILLEYSDEAFLSSDGNRYEGTVRVLSTLMSSSLDKFALKAPGNFQAVDIENKLVGLRPQSLLQISFLDESGNALLIDQEAEVSVQIPTSATAVEAWYYVPSFGLYTINTQTTLENSSLRIGLSHNNFILLANSFDSELNTIQLSALDGSGILEDINAKWITEDGITVQSVLSNNLGIAKINTPITSEGRLTMKDACGNIVYNEAPSNLNSEVLIDNITLRSYEGELYACNVDPIEDGVIAVRQGDQIRYHYISNSIFDLALQVCNNGEANIQGFDGISFGQTVGININLEAEDELGDIFACDDPQVNMLHLINKSTGEECFYPIQSGDGNTANVTEFEFINNGQDINIKVSFNGSQEGDYSANDSHEVEALEDTSKEINFAGDAVFFLVSRFGSTNKLTTGVFEGSFEDVDRQVIEELQGTFNFYFRE